MGDGIDVAASRDGLESVVGKSSKEVSSTDWRVSSGEDVGFKVPSMSFFSGSTSGQVSSTSHLPAPYGMSSKQLVVQWEIRPPQS